VISPASAAEETTNAATPIEVASVLIRFLMTDPLLLLEELATHARRPCTTKLTLFAFAR
jgi:hypothetical protein